MKRQIVVAFVMLLSAHCFADEVPSLKIKTELSESSVLLSNIDRVKYTEGNMVVKLKSGEELVFAMDDVELMTFENVDNTTAIKDAGDLCKNSGFDLKGVSVKDDKKKGIYIIKVGKETKKIAK